MALNGTTVARSSARARGSVAIRIVGELMMRLAGGDTWEFAAFDSGDDPILSASYANAPVDFAALRVEIRLQRFAGTTLPLVAPSRMGEQRRHLCVIFGGQDNRIAILRIGRAGDARPFVARDGAGIERFFRQHSAAISETLVDLGGADDAERVAARRSAPIAFTIDTKGTLLSAIDETDDAADSLRKYLLPVDGELPPVLRSVVGELLERYHAGATAAELVFVTPFALVRLSPLRPIRGEAHALLITVEWLRSRTSLEVTAARYSISKRELQVLCAMLRGAAVAEIGAELSISESTVVFHLKRMLKKTLSRNRTELAARMLGWESSAVS